MKRFIIVVAALAATCTPSFAATKPPTPPPGAIDVSKLQPKQLLPKTKLHTEFVVETNKLGQIARVRSGKESSNATFNAQTYGNALQAFIRTPDGHAIAGTYRLTYDYNPQTQRIHRDVTLLHAGGVNPNAVGAATQMMEIARRNRNRPGPKVSPPAAKPGPAASVNPKQMPDLPQVMKTGK